MLRKDFSVRFTEYNCPKRSTKAFSTGRTLFPRLKRQMNCTGRLISTCVTAAVTTQSAPATNAIRARLAHPLCRGGGGAHARGVCAPRGSAFGGTCAHHVGQSSNSFTHSFTAPACHRLISGPAGYTHAPCAWPCLLLHGGAPCRCRRKEEPLTQISTQLNIAYKDQTWQRNVRSLWDLKQVPQRNHIKMDTTKQRH